MQRIEFEVWQDGEVVASASGPRDDAMREAVTRTCILATRENED